MLHCRDLTFRANCGRKQLQQKPGRGPFRQIAKLI
jgi:hypothetical protein